MYNISIIVLNYNSTEDTIFCVNKINSFDGDYHIIVVDNCSTDNSFDIIKRHFKEDHNVDVIKTDSNGGYSSGN
ncbi:glycosyltransferase, partial [Lactobacillus delbrueckii subsp. bulgaricus]